MSFAINFMYNKDPLNKISKNPDQVIQLTGTLRDGASIVDPVIMIEYDGGLPAVNYAYIPSFNRYYYITDIVSVRNNLWRIAMHCDVLKSFSEGILGSPCVVSKSSSHYNLYLNDPEYKCYQDPIIITKTFPSGFSNPKFVIAIMSDKQQIPHG